MVDRYVSDIGSGELMQDRIIHVVDETGLMQASVLLPGATYERGPSHYHLHQS
jgi:hypothetical protein